MKTVEQIVQQSQQAKDLLGENYQIFRLAGDASSREYFRILYGDHQTCTLMLMPEGAASMAEEYESTQRKITTLPFVDVQNLLISKDVRVPEIYVDDTQNRILLLEDLGDTQLIDVYQKNPEKYFLQSLQLLSKIANPKKTPPSIALERRFDFDLYVWEFDHYIEYGIQKIIEYKESEIVKIKEQFHNISHTYTTWDTQLTHRDYHSKNLMILDDQTQATIDFQDALLGPVYYDLASLLKDAYTKIDRSLQEKLVFAYQQMLDPALPDASLSKDEFLFRFDLMSLHRNLKAAGRFVYIDQVKNNPNYLKDVPQALSYAIDTVSLHHSLRHLQVVLKPYMLKLIEEV
ncbi:MAG: phosphotransferase [Bdellovibrionales bacterium]|nr:phosphotransferase [Bdellovibrionales bacterium]